MKKLGTSGFLFAVAALALVTADPPSLWARQSNPNSPAKPAPPPSANPAPRPSKTDLTSPITILDQQVMGMRKAREMGDQDRQQLALQLTKDFERLEAINAEQLSSLSLTSSLDYKKLSDATAEIRDRAMRIKYNIPLPLKAGGEKIRYENDAAQLGSMLPQLRGVIKGFLENPVFHVAAPNDAELRQTAGRDLETIIKLSATVNKIAKRLSKAEVANK